MVRARRITLRSARDIFILVQSFKKGYFGTRVRDFDRKKRESKHSKPIVWVSKCADDLVLKFKSKRNIV